MAQALAGLAPADPDYARLIAEKARLEALDRTAPGVRRCPTAATLHPGDAGPRVAELRGRLARLGYLVPDAELAGSDFDPELQQAVEAFQRDYGLNDDGVVGARTLDAINAPVETRLAQVAVNLERLRWTNVDSGPRYLLVNIPDFTVRLIEAARPPGSPRWSSARPTSPRPRSSPGSSAPWSSTRPGTSPTRIAIRDYLPKLQKDPMVLKRQNIRLLTRGGTEIDPQAGRLHPVHARRASRSASSSGRATTMRSGRSSSCSRTSNSVYMHDTPHRELFARDVRAFSNGCIRLQKPVELAHILLTGQVPDPAASYAGWVAGRTERAVPLKRPVPVHIVYRTDLVRRRRRRALPPRRLRPRRPGLSRRSRRRARFRRLRRADASL